MTSCALCLQGLTELCIMAAKNSGWKGIKIEK